ncbi:hypothetical protein JTB14_028553 [Gonioctena quinquepunctata]|nr:hypothetical protein JTB14_028553 [Gonioctena quinquepunctata]
MMDDVRRHNGEKIIMPNGGSPRGDIIGEYWCDWMSTLNLSILNDGEKPTFFRRQTESHIDITCLTHNIQKIIRDWQVLEDETLTDHLYIYFSLTTTKSKLRNTMNSRTVCDWDLFKELVTWRITAGVETKKDLGKVLKETYRGSPKVNEKTMTSFWWNEDIKKKKECLRLRRSHTRINKRTPRNEDEMNKARKDQKRCRKELQYLINQSKKSTGTTYAGSSKATFGEGDIK